MLFLSSLIKKQKKPRILASIRLTVVKTYCPFYVFHWIAQKNFDKSNFKKNKRKLEKYNPQNESFTIKHFSHLLI